MAKMTYGDVLNLVQELNELKPTVREFELLLKKNVEILNKAYKKYRENLDPNLVKELEEFEATKNKMFKDAENLLIKNIGKVNKKPTPKQQKKIDKFTIDINSKAKRFHEKNKDMINRFVKHRDEIHKLKTEVKLITINEKIFPGGLSEASLETLKPLMK